MDRIPKELVLGILSDDLIIPAAKFFCKDWYIILAHERVNYNFPALLITHSYFRLLKWAYSKGCLMNRKCYNKAIIIGNKRIFKWLLGRWQWDEYVYMKAAEFNKVKMLELMIKNWTRRYDENALEVAASYGNLDTVKWFGDRHIYCSSDIMNTAAKYGHFNVVKWLRGPPQHCELGSKVLHYAAKYDYNLEEQVLPISVRSDHIKRIDRLKIPPLRRWYSSEDGIKKPNTGSPRLLSA